MLSMYAMYHNNAAEKADEVGICVNKNMHAGMHILYVAFAL